MRAYAAILLLLVHLILVGIGIVPGSAAGKELFLSPEGHSNEKIDIDSSSSSSLDHHPAGRPSHLQNSFKSHFSKYTFSKEWRNRMDNDDKRMVPTGPNPLHNSLYSELPGCQTTSSFARIMGRTFSLLVAERLFLLRTCNHPVIKHSWE